MAQINKPTDYFETTTYAGGTTAITSLDFSPDWVWAKKRTGAENHGIFDSVRGATKTINSNTSSAESTRSGALTSFDSNGWSMGGADGIISASGSDYVAWSWRGSDSSAVSNTDGSITSTISANTTSGFSIVSYTGNLTSGVTVGHGLSAVPKMIIIKNRDDASAEWNVYHGSLGATKGLKLNTTDSAFTATNRWNDTEPTSSVFTLGNATDINDNAENYIAYCFAEKKGFSKFGKFTSNGSDDGTFTYCGFKPAWVMMKANVTDAWSNWYIFDTKRDVANITDSPLYANLSTQEAYYGGSPATNYSQIDMLSNGFKMRRDGNWGLGGSGTEVIYMAFAEQPLVGTNDIPATAR